jgi:hypothetical protein
METLPGFPCQWRGKPPGLARYPSPPEPCARGVLLAGLTKCVFFWPSNLGVVRPIRTGVELRALVRDPEGSERFLRHQNLWSPPPALAPARAPPYHRSVTHPQPTRQQDLFPEA